MVKWFGSRDGIIVPEYFGGEVMSYQLEGRRVLQVRTMAWTARRAVAAIACMIVGWLPVAAAADPVGLPSLSAASANTTGKVSVPETNCSRQQSYCGLQGMWDATYKLENVASDALKQGTYWSPRVDWLDYYGTTMGQAIAALKQEMDGTVFLPDQQAVVGDLWARAQVLLKGITARHEEFQASIQGDQKAIMSASFHKPARAIVEQADQLDKVLLDIYRKIDLVDDSKDNQQSESGLIVQANDDVSSSAQPSTTVLQGSVQALQSNVGVQAIGEAVDKVHKAAFDMIGELERWNLLWGQPTGGQGANYLYGGGLTKQEILTQYKYLPQVAFTFPSYVQRFSYRLPPREKFLVMYTTEMGKLINLMNGELEDTKLPPDKQPLLGAPWQVLQDTFKDAIKQYTDLLKMVNETTDDRLKKDIREDELNYGKPVVAIYDDMDKMRHALSDINQILKD